MTSEIGPVYFLLVDDLEENLLSLEGLLRRDGLVLLKARSGPEALELLLQYDVALAILDVQMPEMDGYELAELMRGTERTRRAPIIFLTAGAADRQRRFRGYEAGAVDFLNKPIEPDILRSKASVFFELYQQRTRSPPNATSSSPMPRRSRRRTGARTSSWPRSPMSCAIRSPRYATGWTSCGRRQRRRTPRRSATSWTGSSRILCGWSTIFSMCRE